MLRNMPGCVIVWRLDWVVLDLRACLASNESCHYTAQRYTGPGTLVSYLTILLELMPDTTMICAEHELRRDL